jgi:hypothetical protein
MSLPAWLRRTEVCGADVAGDVNVRHLRYCIIAF